MLNGCAYILTVDVGNTFIRFGLFAEDSAAAQECPLATCEITTPSSITADEARMRLAQVMGALSADAGMPGALVPAAAVLSCVVPALERPWKAALSRTCTGRVLTVGPGLKTGMPVHYDDPAEIGPDRIADAVAARAVYGSPCIVIDLGTTTNIEVIDVHGTFVGGVIAPGLALGARSLSAAAARLPQVEPSAPTHVIGRNTREAMRSGVVLGEVARIDGMLDMVLAEMRATKAAGEGSVPIVITGDDAEALAAGGALFIVQLQQTGLTGSPGSHDAEHYGQVVTGLTDGFISGGHQERGRDHQNEGDNSGQDVGVDVLHGRFLLKIVVLFWCCFPFVIVS